MHPGCSFVIDLDAIHSDVSFAGIGVLSDHARERDKATPIERPALKNGQIEQSWPMRVER